MKFSDLEIVAAQPMGVRRGRAAELVGAPVILDLMVQARWVEPTIQGNRLTVFDYEDLRAAWRRLKLEGYEALRTAAYATG